MTARERMRGGNGDPTLLAPGLRNHFVYHIYDKDGDVIYVGCSRRPFKRWREHKQDGRMRGMVSEAARFKMFGPFDYPTARRIERERQYDLRPRYNTIPITRDRNEAAWIAYAPFTYLEGGTA